MKKVRCFETGKGGHRRKIEALVSKATRSESDDAEFDTLRTELEGMNRKIEREEACLEKFRGHPAPDLAPAPDPP